MEMNIFNRESCKLWKAKGHCIGGICFGIYETAKTLHAFALKDNESNHQQRVIAFNIPISYVLTAYVKQCKVNLVNRRMLMKMHKIHKQLPFVL